jgi:hypothetical protein
MIKQQQRGISFIGLIIIGGLLAFLGVVGAQALPTMLEYQAVIKAAKKAAAEGNTVPEVRASFDRAAAIDDISSISGKDLEITKENDKVVVSFAYQREIHLGGPVYLLFKYSGRS